MPRTSPSEGQRRCQGLARHAWDPIPTPQGYRTMWWLTVHFRCMTCGTIRITHLDSHGYATHDYKYPHDWVKYSAGEVPSYADKRLDYVKALPKEFVARSNGRKR